MYHKFLATIIVIFSFSFTSQAVEFTEGDNYIEIKGEVTKNKEITEFFSFFCPHCFKQEPFMKQIVSFLPKDASFKKNHVDAMPGQNIEIERALTKALVVADILKIQEVMIPAIFKYVHISRAKFSSIKDIRNLFLINGVDGKKFDKTFSSFSVNAQFNKMQKKTELLRSQGIGSVPTLIINGKYKPVTDNIKSMEEYKNLILFLLNKTA